MAVYFPRGQQRFSAVKKKFLDDLAASLENAPQEFVFVTNQELSLGERRELHEAANDVPVELYHLERITAILDKPLMAGIRKQFLDLEFVQTWPDPAVGEYTLEQLALQTEFVVSGRVEVLARVNDRLIVWLKLPAEMAGDPPVRNTLLGAACVLSGVAGGRACGR